MSFTGETDERMPCVHSPDEASGGGGNAEGSEPLKKGPWTAVEDAILVDHVIRHGEGNWNAVQKNTGLARCGKSCRLRWANHLRPDLKKGKFTPDEERQIIELQATMGNKWARIAAQMPGRTDNEIKNFWNTRIKRRLRLGLPVYPHHISLLASQNRHQEEESGGASSSAVSQHPGASTTNSSDIPAVEFKNLELNKLLYPPSLVETYFVPTMHPPKRTRGSKKPAAFFSGSNADFSRASFQYQSNTSSLLAQPLGFSSYNHSNDDHYRSFPGSHSPSNGNSTSSGPAWTSKLELPSLQIQNLPSLESVDTLILSLPARHGESSNSGLLDAVLYGSQAMNAGNSQSQTMNASEDNSHQQQETSSDAVNNLWETCGDPISPLSHFTASLFSDYTPVSASSLHELPSTARMAGCEVKQENDGLRHLDDTSNQMIFSRPDGKNPVALKDASDAGFYDDYGWDSKRICSVATSSGQPFGRESCAWDATSSAM